MSMKTMKTGQSFNPPSSSSKFTRPLKRTTRLGTDFLGPSGSCAWHGQRAFVKGQYDNNLMQKLYEIMHFIALPLSKELPRDTFRSKCSKASAGHHPETASHHKSEHARHGPLEPHTGTQGAQVVHKAHRKVTNPFLLILNPPP